MYRDKPPARFASPVSLTYAPQLSCTSIVAASDGLLYCAPLYSSTLLQIEPTTFAVTEVELPPEYVNDNCPGSCIVEGPDAKLYIAPDGGGHDYSHVHVFDLSTQQTSLIFGPQIFSYQFWGIAKAPSGKLYCLPGRGREALVVDTHLSSMHAIDGVRPTNGVAVGRNGWLCCSPLDGNYVLAINSNDESLHYMYDDSVLLDCGLFDRWIYFEDYGHFPPTSQAFSGIAAAPNGKFYCCPQDSENILVIDLEAWRMDAFGDLGAQTQKWAGITLASDGRLYCAPWMERSVLMIDPSFHTLLFINVDWGPWGAITSCGDRIWFAPYNARGFMTMLLPRTDFRELKIQGHNFDLVIKTDEDDVQIEVHKCIVMMASSVFERMLADNSFVEGNTSTIRIQGASTQSVQHLVEYFYSGMLPPGADCVELAGLAQAYRLDLLLAFCLEALFDRLTPANVIDTVKILKLHQDATPESCFWWKICKEQVLQSRRLCLQFLEAA